MMKKTLIVKKDSIDFIITTSENIVKIKSSFWGKKKYNKYLPTLIIGCNNITIYLTYRDDKELVIAYIKLLDLIKNSSNNDDFLDISGFILDSDGELKELKLK